MLYGGGSIKRNGVYEQVLAALDGYDVHEFSGIEPNPAYETLVKAIAYIREHDISYLLAVGGGSVIDGTKFIAAAVDYPATRGISSPPEAAISAVHCRLPVC